MEVPEPSTVSFIGSCVDSADIGKNGIVQQTLLQSAPGEYFRKIAARRAKPKRQVLTLAANLRLLRYFGGLRS
jgi:hypothetical protein